MAGEWSNAPFGQLVENFDSIRVPVKEADRRPGRYPYYGASGVVDHVDSYIFDGEYLLVAEDGENLKTRQTPIAFLATGKFWVNNHAHIVRANAHNDTRFLMYAMRVADIGSYLTGSTMPKLTQANMNRVPIVAPPLAEQRAIARILGALDDKIELNRKMNATLEAMARALFKSWFVQEPEADWKTAPLAEWVGVLSGGTPSKSNAAFWGGTLKWISPKAMTSIHADECDDHVSEQAVGNGTRIAPKGSTLVMVRGMGLHDGVRVSQAREDVTFNQDVKALVPRTIETDLLLFAMLDAQEELHKRVETSGHGTGKMPSEILLAHPITMPSREVQRERAVHISAMNDRIAANRSESRSLARMRDELLPRLLSGDLSVAHAERNAEAVV